MESVERDGHDTHLTFLIIDLGPRFLREVNVGSRKIRGRWWQWGVVVYLPETTHTGLDSKTDHPLTIPNSNPEGRGLS